MEKNFLVIFGEIWPKTDTTGTLALFLNNLNWNQFKLDM